VSAADDRTRAPDAPPLTAADIKAAAAGIGFDLCGIAPADDHVELRFYREWLDRGYAAGMDYLHRSADRRADVRRVMPSARSVIALATVYNVDRPYSVDHDDPRRAALARYAWGDDYHTVIERRMEALLTWMRARVGEPFEARAYVDTGPVQERVYAQYAGLGWIGKNTCLINPELGSWLFLSEIICSLPLEPDRPGVDHCAGCTRCLEACPTGALVEPGVLDSSRCLSYLTIENKGAIPLEFRDAIGAHAYGCDICQEVCPWNAAPLAARSADSPWQPRPGFDGATLAELWSRSDDELRALMKGSATKRAGVRRLRRNLAVALGNSGDRSSVAALQSNRSPTCDDELVVEHLEWAVEKLSG
jgi:epoxyqueuosine reductase